MNAHFHISRVLNLDLSTGLLCLNDTAGCCYQFTLTSVRRGRGGNDLEIHGLIPYAGFPAVHCVVWRRRSDQSWWCGVDLHHLSLLEEVESISRPQRTSWS